jgi:inner membrane protein
MLMSFLFAALGSIVPDIDHEYAASRICPALLVIFICAFLLGVVKLDSFSLIGIFLFVLMLLVAYETEHRTLTHSMLGLLLFAFPLPMVNNGVVIPFMIGYVSHIVADSFTKTGTNYLYPMDKTKYGPKLVNIHETGDLIFFIPSLAALVVIFLNTYDIRTVINTLLATIF